MKRVKIGMGNGELKAEKRTIYEKFTQKMTILHKDGKEEVRRQEPEVRR